MCFLQESQIQFRVNLSAGQIRMTQEFLHIPDICARLEQMGCARMPEAVGRNRMRKACVLCIFMNHRSQITVGQYSSVLADKQQVYRLLRVYYFRSSCLKILAKIGQYPVTDRYDPVFTAFARNEERSFL
jgi:hypothetical protein